MVCKQFDANIRTLRIACSKGRRSFSVNRSSTTMFGPFPGLDISPCSFALFCVMCHDFFLCCAGSQGARFLRPTRRPQYSRAFLCHPSPKGRLDGGLVAVGHFLSVPVRGRGCAARPPGAGSCRQKCISDVPLRHFPFSSAQCLWNKDSARAAFTARTKTTAEELCAATHSTMACKLGTEKSSQGTHCDY